MELQFHAEGQPRSEALRLLDLVKSNHSVASPNSPTGHGVFMHHQVTHKRWHHSITVLQGYNHNVNGLKEDLKIEHLCQAFYEEQIDFGCPQETWLSGNYQCKTKTKHAGKPVS
eukprot:6432391-Ditylum_brightwellii.AAC.1